VTIAYLVNRYPAVSHTFVRREIEALEASSATVLRYTIRASEGPLPDPRDAAEVAKTRVVLSAGAVGLLFATLRIAVTRPAQFLKSIRIAWLMAQKAGRDRWRQGAYLAEAAWLVSDWQKCGVSHVHAHFGTNPAAVARLARAMGGPPYSFTVHGPDEFDAPGPIDLNGKIADAAFVAAISNYGRSQLMRWSDWRDWPKIRIVRCGLDTEFIAAAPSPMPGQHRLCYVGRLSAQKGLPILIDAVAAMSASVPDLGITIVGDGPLRNELEARATALGIAHHLTFVGAASNADVRQYVAAARALVVPSFAEGLPVVIMEALALGRPVIATAIAGIPELVDAEDGWIVPAGNVQALATAMRSALSASPDKLAELGAVGRERVAEQHDASKNARTLAALVAEHAA
jgi:colanic acid/amylovoran biosynthesis glycosyltransferase